MDEGVLQVLGENLLASWEGPGKNLANPSAAGGLQSHGPWADPGSEVSNHGVLLYTDSFSVNLEALQSGVFFFF